jgi:hypothetical protein
LEYQYITKCLAWIIAGEVTARQEARFSEMIDAYQENRRVNLSKIQTI